MTSEDGKENEDERRRKRIEDRRELLWKLTASCESDVAQYLLLANSGGAVATLSFMGAASELRAMWGPRVALCAFLLGVLACGLTLGARALNASAAYVQFLEDARKFDRSEISWDALIARSSPTRGTLLARVLAIAAYLCLLIGAMAGALTVWPHVS
jgi:hypothetical protein